MAPSTAFSRVIRNAISSSSRFTEAMNFSASAREYGCGMRAVFSAMRRSFASCATALAPSRRGARNTSRSVSRTGIQLSRKVSAALWSNRVMARAPSKASRGSRLSRLPLKEPVRFRRFDWDAGGPRIGSAVLLGRRLRDRHYGHVGAAFCFGTKRDLSVYECEKRVILAHSHIMAGVPFGAALARENVAGEDRLPAEQLHAEAPTGRVAAVAR